MQIYNTMTRQKEELKPITPGTVKIYACGPTVYNLIHIGNARALCVFDTLRRYLEFRGYKVFYVQNFTDVDDKIIKKANELGKTAHEVSENAIREYFTDADGLNVRRADVHPKVTENMDIIIDIVKTLIEKGFAYEADGDVYFETSKFPEYGKLCHQPMEELQAGARISVGEVKEDPMDFALWKGAKPGEPAWDCPWGKGRPGWHIECSAMSMELLGPTFDIHAGGQDLIFPHHENEIAQSEADTGKPFARYWMHNGYINVDNQKMSKSLGNFRLVRDIAQEFDLEAVRLFLLSAQYRNPINFTRELIEQANTALTRIRTARERLAEAKEGPATAEDESFIASLAEHEKRFCDAMDDDLNTADALGAMFDYARAVNTFVTEPRSKEALERAAKLFDDMTNVLGILQHSKSEEFPKEAVALLNERAEAQKLGQGRPDPRGAEGHGLCGGGQQGGRKAEEAVKGAPAKKSTDSANTFLNNILNHCHMP